MNINVPEGTVLPAGVGEGVQDLVELTGGHTSGIIVCDEMVTVADWGEVEGLPCFSFSYDITFIQTEHVTLTECRHADDIRDLLPGRMVRGESGSLEPVDMVLVHDDCNDIPVLFGRESPYPGMLYRLAARGESLMVIVPDEW